MAERLKRVIVRKKVIKKRDKVELTPTELLEIKIWILTGSFSKEFYSDVNIIDMNKIHLLKRASFSNPKELTRMMLDNNQIVMKKDTLLLTLIFLSMGSFQAKHEFRLSFSKIVKTPNDLYKFLSLMKRYRGMGSIIHLVIKKWFILLDINYLERMFVGEPSKYGWSGQDIIRLIKPKPRDKKESLLFKWLSKGEIGFNERRDYQEKLPLIYYYEQLRTNTNTAPISSIIESFGLESNMIPGNAYRDKDTINSILESKTDEELLSYSNGRLYVDGVVDNLNDRINSILKEERKLNIDIIETIKLANNMVAASVNTSTIMNLETIIENQVKSKMDTSKSVHIIDMSADMFIAKPPASNIPPAVIASIISSSSKRVYDFNGAEKFNHSMREIIEAEGAINPSYKLKPLSLDSPDTIFVWTNKKYLGNIEKELGMLKAKNITSNICLINLGEGKISNKNHRYFVINGYNIKTKKIMRLIERGMI